MARARGRVHRLVARLRPGRGRCAGAEPPAASGAGRREPAASGPPALAAIGYALETSTGCASGDFCGLAGIVIGSVAGTVTAVAIDAAALAWETPLDPRGHQAKSPRVCVAPTLGATGRGEPSLGLAGTF